MKDPAQPTNGQHPPARATVVVEVGGLCWATEKALVEQVLAGRVSPQWRPIRGLTLAPVLASGTRSIANGSF